MKANNGERLAILLSLNNKFSYQEFKTRCEADNIELLQPIEFANKSGIVFCAMAAYTDLDPIDAYTKFIVDNPMIYAPMQPATDSTQCGGCGGGEVK